MYTKPYTEIINPIVENSSIFCSNYIRSDKDWDVSSHLHKEMELLYQVEGQKIIYANQLSYPLSTGDIILVGNNVPHSTHIYKDSLDFFVQFQAGMENDTENYFQRYLLFCNGNIFLFKNGTEINEAIKRRMITIIEENQKQEFGYQGIIKSEVVEIVILLHRYHILQSQTTKQFPEWLHTAVVYMNQHYDEIRSLNEISQKVNVTHTHFCRVFKQFTGQTPVDYLNYIKISHAELLLKQNAVSITDIAFQTGFGSVAYFSKIFKQYKFCTPGEYRKINTKV